jgi:hypothetical protein
MIPIMVKNARWVWVAVAPCLIADDQRDHPAHHDHGEGDRSVALTGLQATMGQGSATLSTSITL